MAVGDLALPVDWSSALRGVHCVVHTAARVHVMQESHGQPLEAFRAVNLLATQRLAEAAAQAGVQRLVFLSSLKVHGERTVSGSPFTVRNSPAPADAYAMSKWEAEQALWQVAARTGLEVVVLRPPLVYGPGVKANFRRLMGWVARGVPLPLGRVDNARSLVGLDNLIDVLLLCAHHKRAAGETFLVSDGADPSTPALIRAIAQAMRRPARLVPMPPQWLRAAAGLAGFSAEVERLTDSLQVDIGHTRHGLGWSPRWSLAQGLQGTVQEFLR